MADELFKQLVQEAEVLTNEYEKLVPGTKKKLQPLPKLDFSKLLNDNSALSDKIDNCQSEKEKEVKESLNDARIEESNYDEKNEEIKDKNKLNDDKKNQNESNNAKEQKTRDKPLTVKSKISIGLNEEIKNPTTSFKSCAKVLKFESQLPENGKSTLGEIPENKEVKKEKKKIVIKKSTTKPLKKMENNEEEQKGEEVENEPKKLNKNKKTIEVENPIQEEKDEENSNNNKRDLTKESTKESKDPKDPGAKRKSIVLKKGNIPIKEVKKNLNPSRSTKSGIEPDSDYPFDDGPKCFLL